MSMDDVFNTMNAFEQELEGFNERLQESFEDLRKHHDIVSPFWDDEMRRNYDIQWLQLEEKMVQYVSVEGGNYVGELLEKIRNIRGYLYGN